uniref:Interleukin 1 receptor type 2 n=1 Tax=Leptobrachium leishanense TaxID=445787 RepID=A0A8C5MTL6_9ANUR
MKVLFLLITVGHSLSDTFGFSVSRLDSPEQCQNRITHFKGYYVLGGEPAAIQCPTFSYLQMQYSDLSESSQDLVWSRNYSENFNVGEESRIQAKEDLLWFFPTKKEDTGTYSCILRNSSFCLEVTVHFNVMALTEVTLADIAYGQITVEQHSFQMNCPDMGAFTRTHTDVNLRWLKDGNLLSNDGKKYEVLDGSTHIHIKDVNKEDEGYYTCEYTFTHDNKEYSVSRIISLQVIAQEKRDHPIIVQPSHKTIAASIGSKLTIPCKVFTGFGGSNLIVWWLANGTYINEIFEDGRVTEGSFQETKESDGIYIEVTLFFENVSEEDFSTDFKCIASNDYGTEVLPTQIRQAGRIPWISLQKIIARH